MNLLLNIILAVATVFTLTALGVVILAPRTSLRIEAPTVLLVGTISGVLMLILGTAVLWGSL